jgi:hypothetical protein
MKAYLETTIFGYLAARRTADVITAGNQQLTKDWWSTRRHAFELYYSLPVIDECSAGDPTAAQERLVFLAGLQRLDITPECRELAARLIKEIPLPPKADVDALHMAVSAVHGMDYLLTWNCAHIANAALLNRIEKACRSAGFEPPRICTPQQLMKENTDVP